MPISTSKMVKHDHKAIIFAITFSIAAFIISIWAGLTLWQNRESVKVLSDSAAMDARVAKSIDTFIQKSAQNADALKGLADDAAFNARVEQGIQAFIAKQQAQQQPTAPTGPVDVSLGSGAMMGKKGAPVTIIEFSDFQCPFCERFYSGTLPELKSAYIDTGKARLVFRNFPLSFHQNAKPAAIAAECVKEQKGDEAFFQFHDLIFANQSSLSPDTLKSWASQVGVNAGDFSQCTGDPKTAALIDADEADGMKAGVQGTPAFFINGRLLSGAQPFAAFQQVIDEELKK